MNNRVKPSTGGFTVAHTAGELPLDLDRRGDGFTLDYVAPFATLTRIPFDRDGLEALRDACNALLLEAATEAILRTDNAAPPTSAAPEKRMVEDTDDRSPWSVSRRWERDE